MSGNHYHNTKPCDCSGEEQKGNKRNGIKTEANTVDEMLPEKLSQAIDFEVIGLGIVIADLFKMVSLAAAHLPNMELYSDMISVVVDEDSITVCVTGLKPESDASHCHKHGKACFHGCNDDSGYEEDDYDPHEDDVDDEEEGLIYDGD